MQGRLGSGHHPKLIPRRLEQLLVRPVAPHRVSLLSSLRVARCSPSPPLVMLRLPPGCARSAPDCGQGRGRWPPPSPLSRAPERMDELSRLLNGFVLSDLTIASGSGTQDAAGLVDRLLSAFLD